MRIPQPVMGSGQFSWELPPLRISWRFMNLIYAGPAMDKRIEKQFQQPRNNLCLCQPYKRVTQGTTVPNKPLSVSPLYH